MDNSENFLSFIFEKLVLLCVLVFVYFCYLHMRYKDNQPVLAFEGQCREIHANKKFYKSYCTCLAHGLLTSDIDSGALMVAMIFKDEDDNKSKKITFNVLEKQILKQNQCSFKVSYIQYVKESLIK